MHPYGWLSLVPPIVAVVLAIATHRVLASLLVGLYAGALVTTGGDAVQAAIDLGEKHLWPTFIQPDKLRLFCFTVTMGALIGLLHASGGMLGFVRLMTPLAGSRRSAQATGWGMGMAIFFDDYANTLLLGGALRPVFDRLRLSREKLSYIVDSTAAPVAGLALVSTWVAVEIAYLQEGLDGIQGGAPAGASALDLFVACLPYRFYVIQALAMVLLVALMGRDFGPMLAAERAALAAEGAAAGSDADAEPAAGHWAYAVAPLAVMLATILGLLYASGAARLAERGESTGRAPLREVFGAADSGLALQYGGLVGLGLALAMVRVRGLLTSEQTRNALVRGALTVLPAVAILWFASTMSRMTGAKGIDGDATVASYEHRDCRLYTGEYLSRLVLGDRPAGAESGDASAAAPSQAVLIGLPTGVFLLSCLVAFSTGTSFGTMGLVVPMVAPIAYAAATGAGMSPAAALDSPLFLASIGAVMAGAIFGDHCSPISDTTILSSQASGCDHMAHVRTQLPYALATAVVCVALGTAPVALGVSVWLLLPLQTAALAGLLLAVGEKA